MISPEGEGGPRRFLGILREPVYSLGKVDDDRAILEEAAARLAAHHDVRVISAVDPLPDEPSADVVFTMAQGPAPLAVLRRWQSTGVRVINTPEAIESCHRRRMIAAFAVAGVQQPPSVLVRIRSPEALPAWIGDGAWVKRGDVHATQADDVAYVTREADVSAVLANFDRRGIAEAIIQRHVQGSVIKFYAVRGTFFTWFRSREGNLALSPDAVAAMRALAEHGATALGVEVFGGDCVRQPDGVVQLIDLNDWPSYARCRPEAADAIARYVATQGR